MTVAALESTQIKEKLNQRLDEAAFLAAIGPAVAAAARAGLTAAQVAARFGITAAQAATRMAATGARGAGKVLGKAAKKGAKRKAREKAEDLLSGKGKKEKEEKEEREDTEGVLQKTARVFGDKTEVEKTSNN